MESWYLYSILSLVITGLWGFFGKMANRHGVSAMSLMIVGSIVSFALAAVFLLTNGYRFEKAPMGMLFAIIVSVLGFSGALFFFVALEQGKASLVVTLTALYPAITVLLSWWALHEQLTVTQTIGVVLGIFAAVLVAI